MKTLIREMSYEQVLAEKPYEHRRPRKQSTFLRRVVEIASFFWLFTMCFKCEKVAMEKLEKSQPCLILMNHSSFVDLAIAARLFGKRPYHIISTLDGFIGKAWLMRMVGCIPTKKYITDATLVRDMVFVTKKLKSSVVMFPEACYSFDGTATTLPGSLGKCIKLLQVPVVMVHTHGAFARDPLYNGIQVRKVKVSAKMEYILSPEDIKGKTVEELNAMMQEQFSFDNFKWQQENQIRIKEEFRADYLNRVLYKCPHCGTEGKMLGKGIHLLCHNCNKRYELTEYGYLKAVDGEEAFTHIPDWYRWQRQQVREEILNGTYLLDTDVDICMLVNTKCIYRVGKGHLIHDKEGFHLTGCDGKIDYWQPPELSYSLNADFFWYEIGDVICVGNADRQYYCFPKGKADVVAKTKLATEELYKLKLEKLI